MKDLKNMGAFYSAKEIIQIIDHAKKAGVVSIRIPGFEADWRLERGGEKPEAPPAPRVVASAPLAHQRGWEESGNGTPSGYPNRPAPRVEIVQGVQPVANYQRAPICSKCGAEMIIGKNSGRFYCDPCFVARKKAKGEWEER